MNSPEPPKKQVLQTSVKPIYLLSDSQLLFTKSPDGQYYLDGIAQSFAGQSVKAVYIGASNNDQPEFYEIFKAGMSNIGIHDCTMINSAFDSKGEQQLRAADLVLLAGGNAFMGWNTIKETGMLKIIADGYSNGVQLIGVSAGSMQLGAQLFNESADSATSSIVDTMNLVPYNMGAHDEANEWQYLKKLLKLSKNVKKGIGIPFGAGVIYHPDGTIKALGKSIHIFEMISGTIREELLSITDL